MSRIFADNAHSIGNTPLVQINRIAPRGVTILAKIEGRNPCLLYTSPSPRDATLSRMPSSA